ncbi:MAG: thioredoxin domain-containing protein [bacterium]
MRRTLLIAACLMLTPQFNMSRAQTGPRKQDPPSSATVQELKKLDRQLDDAFLRGDKTLFERVLADEMISVSAEGDVTRKPDILSQIAPPLAGLKLSLLTEGVEIYSFGDTAIVSSRKSIKEETGKGPSSDYQYRDTNTYVRRDGRWQLIASQQSKLPAPYSAKEVQLNLTIEEALMRGSKGATVVLIEFADYQCPQCRRFEAGTMKQIEKDYIDTGRVGFIVRHTPLVDIHPDAFKAAEAAQCAGAQGRFWEMHHRLFQEPMTLAVVDLLAHAQTLKLDMTKFRQCLSDEKKAAGLRQGMLEAEGFGIKGTPIFLIGVKKPNSGEVKALRMIEGGHPYEAFKASLDSVIKAQTP